MEERFAPSSFEEVQNEGRTMGMQLTAIGRMPLAEIALNTAIELDRPEISRDASIWMRRLADALTNTSIGDFGLMPVYNRALTSVNGEGPASKSDLYAKLLDLGGRLRNESGVDPEDRELLRDFCLALHEGLLNEGFQSHFEVIHNARMQ